jgi:hypothetical protein
MERKKRDFIILDHPPCPSTGSLGSKSGVASMDSMGKTSMLRPPMQPRLGTSCPGFGRLVWLI